MKNKGEIEALKKVTLAVRVGTSPEDKDLTPEPVPFDFIFGIGREGLTLFECELVDKRLGDVFHVALERPALREFLQHVILPPLNVAENSDTLYLEFRVIGIGPADQKEVIKALAEIANCGEHCCGH